MSSGVYILGVAVHPAAVRHDAFRLEELVYRTSRLALEDAGVARADLDSVTLGASDEMDGRPISSMLLAPPAGAFLVDELRVTDSGASALCLATARILSGESHLNLVAAWCKSSKTNIAEVTSAQAEPFFTRPLGIEGRIGDALFAQAVGDRMGISEAEVAERVVGAFERAAKNTRGIGSDVPTLEQIGSTEFTATPLRTGHLAPPTDGAAALILASEEWLRRHPGTTPIARVAGVGWATDSYRLERERLGNLGSARAAWKSALSRAGLANAADLDLVELDTPTGFHEAAYARAFEVDPCRLSPSGGGFAQNPSFCSGLVNMVEATLQVTGRAGDVQVPGAKWGAAHGCHGFGQQGNVVAVIEGGSSA